MRSAALYCRSSKDRKDVSIHDQRRELLQLAETRGIHVVAEFSDAVESGKDWDRPGFQQLIREIRNPKRGWDIVLVKDTARIARRRHFSMIFEEQECAANGVEIVYANVPDGDPATIMILRTLLQAMDEWHSLTSREKGLAGMAENVRRGYRGAGYAPFGFRLKRVDLGIVRDGMAVTKSVLEPNEDAPIAARYLNLRAAGVSRAKAKQDSGIKRAATTLIGMEWNALTYAGCTTLHVFSERAGAGYKGGKKRRPRSEWMIQPDTHQALITRAQAEVILRSLENSTVGAAVSQAKAGMSDYLFTGMLYCASSGNLWEGASGYYRAPRSEGSKRRHIPCDAIDTPILEQVFSNLRSQRYAERLADLAQQRAGMPNHALRDLQARVVEVMAMIDKASNLALQMDNPEPMLKKMRALEAERQQLVNQQRALEEELEVDLAMAAITPDQMQEILGNLADNLERVPRPRLKTALRGLIDRIELDPATLQCHIKYSVSTGINRVPMALPRKADRCSKLRFESSLVITYQDGRRRRWRSAS